MIWWLWTAFEVIEIYRKWARQILEGDPVEVHPPDSRAESQAGLNGPGGSPTSPSKRDAPREEGDG